jgi:carboxyl-terminal processing protease
MTRLFVRLLPLPLLLALSTSAPRTGNRNLEASRLGPAASTASDAPLALAQESDDLGGPESIHDTSPEQDDLAALRIFNRVILLVKENYVDPKRVHPKEMMIAALDYVQRSVPDVIVDSDAQTGRVKVTVGTATKDFDISGVDSLWKLSFTLRDIFGFMQEHLDKTDKPKDIEYAAVAGMLSTLDPHSVFLGPEAFKEMRLQTKGEFGGLGFVIRMLNSHLTVVRVIKDTPAARAGIKAKDQVIKIEEQSTVNLDLNEAVSKLRGHPGTKVVITVDRKGWTQPKRMTLTREIIPVPSVTAKLLDAGLNGPAGPGGFVGGIYIKSFQGNTARDLAKAIAELKVEAKNRGGALKGLVLDLRGDPGGLLEQAIQVTNAFVDRGTIVTTVGYSDKLREVKRAHPGSDVDAEIPLAVLVDNGSASASEIVSGALKNLNRAVIVGRPTFGKGSVQVLYDFVDDTALKLTIAQYLTPGDISIQEIGIVPDVALIPASVSKDAVDLFSPKRLVGEADLEHHFGNPADVKPYAKRADVVDKEKPEFTVLYLDDKKKPKVDPDSAHPDDEDDADEDDSDDFRVDFQVKFAHDLVLAAPVNNRQAMLASARPFVDGVQAHQQEAIDKAITALGVDWSVSTPQGEPRPVVEIKQSPALAQAGQSVKITVQVKNTGTGPLEQLRAYTRSDFPWFDRKEFLFGKVAPGETRSWSVSVKLPTDMATRRDEVKLVFQEAHGRVPEEQTSEVAVVALPRPSFAFSYQLINPRNPTDGLAHAGEDFQLIVDVRNEGTGRASSTAFANLKNLGDDKVFIKKGRDVVGPLKPGESREVTFELQLLKGYKADEVPLQLVVFDEPFDEIASEKLKLPVAQQAVKGVASKGFVSVEVAGPVVTITPFKGGPPIATAKKGAVLPLLGRVDDSYLVEWAKGRIGFIPVADARPSRKPGAPAQLIQVMQHEPPKITVLGLDAQGGVTTDSDHFHLEGSVASTHPVRDAYVFVNEQKVYYRAAGRDENPMRFEKDLPLKPGNNTVTVVAREGDEFSGKRTFVVQRRANPQVAGKADTSPQPAAAAAP